MKGMTQSRTWSLGAVAVIAVLLLASWFLLLAPKRSDAADLRTQDSAAQAQNDQLTSQLQMLKEQSKQLPEQAAKLAAIRINIPDNPALPSLIRSLSDIGEKTQVSLESLAPSGPTPLVTGVPTKAGSPAVGSALQSIPVVLTAHGDFFSAAKFVQQLESLKRSMIVDGFTMATGEATGRPAGASTTPSAASAKPVGAGEVTVTIQARIFMVSDTSAPMTTPTAPTAAPGLSASPKPSASPAN